MTREAPPIVKLAERVLVELELAVRAFPRYHKYAIGSELRNEAREVARCANRAWREPQRRGKCLADLVAAVDDLKLSLQIAMRIQAFRSFAQFEGIARLASDLGRQCGGWQKQHLKGQNRRATLPGERAQILSSRDALQGAYP